MSTIHSFLYRNIVKPYLHRFTDESGNPLVAYELVKRHDEHHPSFKKVMDWLRSISQTWLLQPQFKSQHQVLIDGLRELVWEQSGNREWTIRPRSTNRMGPRLREICRSGNLRAYKSLYWHDGIIDHEDVLYFAHRIFDEYDLAIQFLGARFRYLFIDEFQDTRPVQSRMVEKLAEKGTIIGVIGDEQQSIYGFLGAKPENFRSFSLPGHRDYRIENNRRSTKRIIHLLNHMRMDGLKQEGHRREEGEPIRVFCGEVGLGVSRVREQLPQGSGLTILTRTNPEAGRVRNQTDEDGSEVWEEFHAIDQHRARFLEGVIAATELGRRNQFAIALDELVHAITKRGRLREPLHSTRDISELACRGVGIALLEFMLTNYSTVSYGSVLSAYEQLREHLKINQSINLTKVTKGKFKDFVQSTDYCALADFVRTTEEARSVRTIHKAKSIEWNNVMVWFAEANRIQHLLGTGEGLDSEELEERRVTYVAMSRARDRLFIVVPTLSGVDQQQLEALGIQVERQSA